MKLIRLMLTVLSMGFLAHSQTSPICGNMADDNFYACLNIASNQIETTCGPPSKNTRFNKCMCENLGLTINCYIICPGQRLRMRELSTEKESFCLAARPPPQTTTRADPRTFPTTADITNDTDAENKSPKMTPASVQKPIQLSNAEVAEPMAALVGGVMAAAALLL